MSDHVRVRVVDGNQRLVARLEGAAPDVQRDLDNRAWQSAVTTEQEVFIQIHLGHGEWITFDTVEL